MIHDTYPTRFTCLCFILNAGEVKVHSFDVFLLNFKYEILRRATESPAGCQIQQPTPRPNSWFIKSRINISIFFKKIDGNKKNKKTMKRIKKEDEFKKK